MKTHPLSDGKKYPVNLKASLMLAFCICLTLISCSSFTSKSGRFNEDKAQTSSEFKVEGEVSLKSDRSHLDEVRSEVPENVKEKNDELAFILGLMKSGQSAPHVVRNKFNRYSRKRRDKFRKYLRKKRDLFNKVEKKKRKSFTDALKKEKKDLKSSNATGEQIREGYKEISAKRREFFDDEKDRRKDFESNYREESKNFDADLREKQKSFNEELRAYSKDYRDRKTLERRQKYLKKKLKNKSQRGIKPKNSLHYEAQKTDYSSHPELKEFEELNSKPGDSLSTE